jgi:hypothetical protein
MNATGTCSEAPASSSGHVQFSEGQFKSPIGELMSCVTTQDDCSISVRCKIELLSAHVSFDGTLTPDNKRLNGSAVLTGSYHGCTSVTYSARMFDDSK